MSHRRRHHHRLGALMVAMVALPPALAACADKPVPEPGEYELRVDVDVNPDAVLSTYRTFDIVDPRQEVDGPPAYAFDEVDAEINEAIIDELGAKGLSRDIESPDLFINPLIKLREVEEDYSFYDSYYGWYWGYQHLWTVSYEVSRGSLMLDVVDPGVPEDPEDDMLVYRGTAWGLMAEDVEIIKLELRNAVQAIFEDWPESAQEPPA